MLENVENTSIHTFYIPVFNVKHPFTIQNYF